MYFYSPLIWLRETIFARTDLDREHLFDIYSERLRKQFEFTKLQSCSGTRTCMRVQLQMEVLAAH